jgi:hypothetical protein
MQNLIQNSDQAKHFDSALLLLTFFITLFIPDVAVTTSLHIGLEELLVPIMCMRLLWVRFIRVDILILALLYLLAVIALSIGKNNQYNDYRNLFELYKVFKLGVLYVFSFFIFRDHRFQDRFCKLLRASFIALAFINFFHLFNLFSINEWFVTLYDYDGRDAATFGLNSLGEPDSRRIIGTMGNPNDNAILFLFFLVCFISRHIVDENRNRKFILSGYEWYILTCSILIVLCQSRTGLIVFVGLIIVGLRYSKWSWKQLLYSILILFGVLLMLDVLVQQQAMRYLSNTRVQLEENNSVSSRIEIWKRLITMWKDEPLLGFGPNKDFIYREKIYPENEYIFYLWRYGILGLIGYVLLLWGSLLQRGRAWLDRPMPLLLVILFSLTALTNSPITNPKFVVIFAIGWGLAANTDFSNERQDLKVT